MIEALWVVIAAASVTFVAVTARGQARERRIDARMAALESQFAAYWEAMIALGAAAAYTERIMREFGTTIEGISNEAEHRTDTTHRQPLGPVGRGAPRGDSAPETVA